jgi:hypothetical protein
MNLLDIPRDVFGRILRTPQAARSMSYTCRSARDLLRGLFTCSESDDSIVYTVAGPYFSTTIGFNGDFVVVGDSGRYNIYTDCLPVIRDENAHHVPCRINANYMIVENVDSAVFISRRIWAESLREVVGVAALGIRAIYEIRGIYENFGGESAGYAENGDVPFIHCDGDPGRIFWGNPRRHC